MKHNCAKKIAGGCFALAMTFARAQPMLADDLNTEMASAGAAVDIENYISSTGSEDGLSSYLPAPEKTEQQRLKAKRQQTKTNYFPILPSQRLKVVAKVM